MSCNNGNPVGQAHLFTIGFHAEFSEPEAAQHDEEHTDAQSRVRVRGDPVTQVVEKVVHGAVYLGVKTKPGFASTRGRQKTS